MARRGDGIYLRGRTWWLDFRHNGTRHQERIGRGINKTVAREIAQVKRAAILKGEAGIGKKRKDISFDRGCGQVPGLGEGQQKTEDAGQLPKLHQESQQRIWWETA